jgi:hypothetical protein
MTATSGNQYGSGLRHARILALTTATGLPAAPAGGVVYEGLQVVGAKAFEVTIPDIRRVTHVGDDRLLATTTLPRIEASTAVLRTARNDYALQAVLTGGKVATIGEATVIGHGTNLQGSEPDICALLFQQTQDAAAKTTRYRSYILPVTKAVLNPTTLNENANEYSYQLTPSAVSKYPWGIAFASGTEGYTSAEMVEAMTEGQPMLVAFTADTAQVDFLFHADRPAVSAAKIHVITKDGVVVTTGITKSTTKVAFDSAPGLGKVIVIWYETALAG